MQPKNKIIISAILVAIGVISRLMPHPWNFAPIAAIGLFSGTYLGIFYSLILPPLSIFFSDIFLGFYEWKLMLAVYGSFALISLIGILIKKYKSFKTILTASLSASILFFLITNFAVWLFTLWYPKTFSGLIQCFILALPFFRNTLLGDLFYTGILFGTYELIFEFYRKKQLIREQFSVNF